MDILALLYLFIIAKFSHVELVTVTVNEGQLRGLHRNLSTGLGSYYSFKGIPYAVPPVGKLRFKDPLPAKPWKGEKLAILHGSRCSQSTPIIGTFAGSEDCLFLNVYTPDLKPAKPLPVMFFIHGGSFKFGSGDTLLYGPDFIVQKNVVLVTINYRLGALGFLNIGTKEVPGNAGLKDQNLALKWAHKNIHNFGGDPDQITLIGESAGSASVIYHTMSPMSRGLFKRVIAMSGVPFCEWAISYKLTNRSFALGKLLGKDTNDPEEMLEFLQSVPPNQLVNVEPTVIPEEKHWNYEFKMTYFQPAPEKDFGQERFLVETAAESLKRGNVAKVDLFMGYTSLESLILMPEILATDELEKYNELPELLLTPREITLYGKNPSNIKMISHQIYHKYFGDKAIDKYTIDRFVKYSSEEVFVYNINRYIRRAPSDTKKYLYKFFLISRRNRLTLFGLPFGITGVAHTDDLGYIFESSVPVGGYPVDVNSREHRLIDQTTTLFTNFAKYGNPTPDDSLGAIWPEYDNESMGYLAINDTLVAGYDVDADVKEFWTKIYEEGGAEVP